MPGTKGHSGGARKGAGAPTKAEKKPKPKYIWLRLSKPRTEEERKALRYAKWLSPEDRLRVFQEDETFQDWDDPGPIII